MPHAVVGADVETAGAAAETWGYERTAAVGTLTGIRSAQSNAYRWRTVQPHAGYQLSGVELDGVSRTVGHDSDGRTTQDGSRAYAFDILGELTEVRVAGVLVESYAYDGLGRLSAVFHGAATPTQTFLYDGPNLVAAHSATGQQHWEAVWGPGQDVLLEWVDTAGGTGVHLPLVDHRNSVVGAWGVTAGSLSKTAVYNAEGRVALVNSDGTSSCAEEGSGAVCAHPADMPFGFGTAWRSSTTGLVSMRARWYSPPLGEFLSPDPIGYADSFNLYAYAGFDPINRWDPTGTASCFNGSAAPGCQSVLAGGEFVSASAPTLAAPVAPVAAGYTSVGANAAAAAAKTTAVATSTTTTGAVGVSLWVRLGLLVGIGAEAARESAAAMNAEAEARQQSALAAAGNANIAFYAPGLQSPAMRDPGHADPVRAPGTTNGPAVKDPGTAVPMVDPAVGEDEVALRNPDGQHGKLDHRQTVARLVKRAKEEFPGRIIRQGTFIRKTPNARGLQRKPDVWVEDPVTGAVLKVYEAARTQAKNNFVPREEKKRKEYNRRKIPSHFEKVQSDEASKGLTR